MTSIDQGSSWKGFDRLAPLYDALARVIFGRAIKQSQRATLSFIPPRASILIIGGGTGWILPELMKRTKPERVVYIEASKQMVALSKKRLANLSTENAGTVDFRLGTEKVVRSTEQFDIIITHFLLDLYSQPYVENTVQQLSKRLKPAGLWLCTDFQLPKKTKGHWWQRGLVKSMYLFFQFCCGIEGRQLPDFDKAFAKAGLQNCYSSFFFHQMIAAKVYSFEQAD